MRRLLSRMETRRGSAFLHSKAMRLSPAIMTSLMNRALFLLSRGMSDTSLFIAILGEQGILNPLIPEEFPVSVSYGALVYYSSRTKV